MQAQIRRARPGDEAALALVAQASFLETYAGQLEGGHIVAHCVQDLGAERFGAILSDPEIRTWIVEAAEGAAAVGYAILAAPDLPIPTEHGDLELKRLYVLSRLHGSGLGARLMAATCEAAKAAGARRLWVSVFTENPRAIAFYARQGFDPAGVRKFRVGEGVYDDLVLARGLTAPATVGS